MTDYNDITKETYFHRNFVAAVVGAILVVALITGGIVYHSKIMLDSGYVWVPQVITEGHWEKMK